MASLTVKNLSFRYHTSDENTLDNIHLQIEKGEFFLLFGPSGCGKSTLLRQFKTVLTPAGVTTGEVLLNDTPLKEVSERTQASEIGFVLQSPDHQIVTDKVWHELAFGLESLGIASSEIRLRTAEISSFFGIESWFDKNTSELSGGQKQLLILASTMVLQPSILVLDEPTAQLDPIAAEEFLNTLKKINLELGTTIILCEHRLQDVLPLADRIAAMDNGTIVAISSPREIGNYLKEKNEMLFSCLPVSVQLHGKLKSHLPCPLSIGETKHFLENLFSDKPIKTNSIIQDEYNNSPTPILAADHLWFRYSKDSPDIMKGLCFTVHKGEFFCIIGGNGSGKTTVLNLLSGILKPYRGKIKRSFLEHKHRNTFGTIGVLPQDPSCCLRAKTVLEELTSSLGTSTLTAKEQEKKLSSMITDLDLSRLLQRHPYDLSVGEQQKVALATLLLLDSDTLLLDEPTKGLDFPAKQKLAATLKHFLEDGTTIIMVSHDIEFCAEHTDTCAFLFDGTILTQGSPRSLFSNNYFYTTGASRISRPFFKNVVTSEELTSLCIENL